MWAFLEQGALAQMEPILTNPGLQQQQELQQQQLQRSPAVMEDSPAPILDQREEGKGKDQGQSFNFYSLDIKGAKAVDKNEIKRVFEPLISTTRKRVNVTMRRLNQSVDDANQLYRKQGYFTSRILVPKGALKGGVLTLVALEGFIEKVEVSGTKSEQLKRWVQFYLQPLTSSAAAPKPIRFAEIERQLLLMQGFGGVTFTASLLQGETYGGSKLAVEMKPKYVSASASIDNNVQPLLGNYQVTGQLQANALSLIQPVQINLFGGNAFPYPGGLTSSAASFTTPLGNRGLRLVGLGSFFSTNSTSTPITGLGGSPINLNTAGQSWLGNLTVRYPLLLNRRSSAGISITGEVQNSSSYTYLDGYLAISNPSRLRVLRLALDGSLTNRSYASTASIQLNQGLPIAQAYDGVTWGQSGGSLTAGSVSYTSARANVRHQHRLGSGNTFFTATASGQVTGNILPTPEDFSYGGQTLGRAYRGIYLAGDQGASGGVELSHSWSIKNYNFTPFIFADYGVASSNGIYGSPPNYQASSYGVGLRGAWGSTTSFEVGWGIPSGSYPEATFQAGTANSILYGRATVAF